MSKGRAIVKKVGGEGIVGYETAGQYDFLYRTSTSIDPAFDIGDSAELADGRVFRYARALTECHSAHGCEFTYTGLTSYTAFGVAYAVGAREIISPAATHDALVRDELKGGYIIIFDGVDDSDTTVRGIIGNDASAENAAITLQLDAAIHTAITAGTNASEVYRNPFAALKDGASASKPKAGIPAANATALQFFWVQTTGISWAAPQGTVINNNTGVYWRHDGSVEAEIATGSKSAGVNSTQYAGFLVAGNYAGNGPLLTLRC